MFDFFKSESEMMEALKVVDPVSEAAENSARLLQAGLQLSAASKVLSKAHTERKILEARKFLKLKNYAAQSGERLTIKDYEALIASDEDVIKAKQIETEAQFKADQAKALVDALQQKGMLLQALLKYKTGGII